MRSRWMGLGLFAVLAAAAMSVPACGTEAVGIETCRQIEAARCKRAPDCNIDLTRPVHRDTSKVDSDVAACIRFYDDACLHGLATNADPGAPATKACVDAITNGECAVVLKPETAQACAWLVPPAPAPPADAGTEAGPSDSGSLFDIGLPDVGLPDVFSL